MEQVIGWIGRDVQHWKTRQPLVQTLSQRSSIQLGHDHVGDDQVKVGMGKGGHLECFLAIPCLQGPIPGVAEYAGQQEAYDIFVLGNQDNTGLGGFCFWLCQNRLTSRGIFHLPQGSCPRREFPNKKSSLEKTRLGGIAVPVFTVPSSERHTTL